MLSADLFFNSIFHKEGVTLALDLAGAHRRVSHAVTSTKQSFMWKSLHSEGLALPAGDDGQAFQGTSEGWKPAVGGTDGWKRRTGTEESKCSLL